MTPVAQLLRMVARQHRETSSGMRYANCACGWQSGIPASTRESGWDLYRDHVAIHQEIALHKGGFLAQS